MIILKVEKKRISPMKKKIKNLVEDLKTNSHRTSNADISKCSNLLGEKAPVMILFRITIVTYQILISILKFIFRSLSSNNHQLEIMIKN